MNDGQEIKLFKFKQFKLSHHNSTMKVGTDGLLLGSWADVSNDKRILDVGTGCGLIALMLAQRNTDAQIDAIDIDEQSVNEANLNFLTSQWKNRVMAFEASVQEFEPKQKYDHIVSNPPFFENGSPSPVYERHYARHTETLPLKVLIKNADRLLNVEGMLSVIIPNEIEIAFVENGFKNGLHLIRRTLFHSKQDNKPERSMLCLSKIKKPIIENTLVHYNQDGSWTEGYKNLTQDYHIKL